MRVEPHPERRHEDAAKERVPGQRHVLDDGPTPHRVALHVEDVVTAQVEMNESATRRPFVEEDIDVELRLGVCL